MGLPASGFQLVTVILSAVLTSVIRKSRLVMLVCIFLVAMTGILMVKLLPVDEKISRLAGFWLVTAVAPAFPLMLSLAASNIAGFTKKSTVMALIFLGYCAGNLSGPQFFISTEAPNYHVCTFSRQSTFHFEITANIFLSDGLYYNCCLLCNYHRSTCWI
jgi:hypothetical protein